LGSLGLIGSGLLAGCTTREEVEFKLNQVKEQAERQYTQLFNMHTYAAPALDVVRVGVSGIGNRGSGTVVRLASLEGVEVVAVNDVEEDRVASAIESISDSHNPAGYSDGEEDWKRMCERDDIDLIAIATPWHLHAEQCVFAMEHGKHVYVELPAANTVEECWQLVETSERTRRHCVQMSASCHYGDAAFVLNMVRDGVLGEIIHGEGGYIHDLMNRYNFSKTMYHDLWRLKENIDRDGNLYPQHALTPLVQLMDINYGDQMDYLVSMQTNDFMMAQKAEEMAAEDSFWDPFVGRNYRGNMNNTLIRTHHGRSILVQHDVTSPRPGIRFNLIQGTKGTYQARPGRIGFSYYDGWLSQEEYDSLVEKYTPEITRRFNEMVEQARVAGRAGRSYARVNSMDWRLIDCLRNGLPVEIDVYDSAATSVVTPLSEWSVANGSMPIKVPDFTGGSWQTNERGMRVELESGGGSTRIR
jgi:predicted dehydrogenase